MKSLLFITVALLSVFGMSSHTLATPIVFSGNWSSAPIPAFTGNTNPISGSWAFTVDNTLISGTAVIHNIPVDTLTWTTAGNNYGGFNTLGTGATVIASGGVVSQIFIGGLLNNVVGLAGGTADFL